MYKITSNYGYRTFKGAKDFHPAIDLHLYPDTRTMFITPGMVFYDNKSYPGFGNSLTWDIFPKGSGYGLNLAHFEYIEINEKNGTFKFKEGETGKSSGKHVHFGFVTLTGHLRMAKIEDQENIKALVAADLSTTLKRKIPIKASEITDEIITDYLTFLLAVLDELSITL